MEGRPTAPPMGAAPAMGLASQVTNSMAPRPDVPRPPKLPGFQAPRPTKKKTGPKKKAPAAPTPTPEAPTPTPASMQATRFGIEEDIFAAHQVFEGVSTSVQSFSNMMDDSVSIDNISFSEPFPSVDEEGGEDVMLVSPLTKKRGQRAANYSVDEDVALVSAWQTVSLDAIAGVDQSSTTFWSRISEIFHSNDKTTRTRTIGSLQHRWSTIQECCNKWASCLKQVARLRPSGVPLQEQANLAQERYKDMDRDKSKKRPFTLFHCWTLLQHNEKWANREYECPPKRTRTNSSSSTGDEEDGGDEERERSPTPGSRGSKRPTGRKKEKEMLRKESYGNGCKEAIQQMIETKKQLALEKESRWMDIKAAEERKQANEAERLRRQEANEAERLRLKGEKALAKKREEQKIMFMDITSLNDTQQAYVEAMRAKILAELLGTGGNAGSSSSHPTSTTVTCDQALGSLDSLEQPPAP